MPNGYDIGTGLVSGAARGIDRINQGLLGAAQIQQQRGEQGQKYLQQQEEAVNGRFKMILDMYGKMDTDSFNKVWDRATDVYNRPGLKGTFRDVTPKITTFKGTSGRNYAGVNLGQPDQKVIDITPAGEEQYIERKLSLQELQALTAKARINYFVRRMERGEQFPAAELNYLDVRIDTLENKQKDQEEGISPEEEVELILLREVRSQQYPAARAGKERAAQVQKEVETRRAKGKVVRKGTFNGRPVVQYEDGSVEYAD